MHDPRRHQEALNQSSALGCLSILVLIVAFALAIPTAGISVLVGVVSLVGLAAASDQADHEAYRTGTYEYRRRMDKQREKRQEEYERRKKAKFEQMQQDMWESMHQSPFDDINMR